jgi:hypothetical protein
MTHDERIEAIRRAIYDRAMRMSAKEEADGVAWNLTYRECRELAEAALTAAGVEEMLTEAIWEAACRENKHQWGIDSSDIDEIIKKVMGK